MLDWGDEGWLGGRLQALGSRPRVRSRSNPIISTNNAFDGESNLAQSRIAMLTAMSPPRARSHACGQSRRLPPPCVSASGAQNALMAHHLMPGKYEEKNR